LVVIPTFAGMTGAQTVARISAAHPGLFVT